MFAWQKWWHTESADYWGVEYCIVKNTDHCIRVAWDCGAASLLKEQSILKLTWAQKRDDSPFQITNSILCIYYVFFLNCAYWFHNVCFRFPALISHIETFNSFPAIGFSTLINLAYFLFRSRSPYTNVNCPCVRSWAGNDCFVTGDITIMSAFRFIFQKLSKTISACGSK